MLGGGIEEAGGGLLVTAEGQGEVKDAEGEEVAGLGAEEPGRGLLGGEEGLELAGQPGALVAAVGRSSDVL